MKIGIIGLGKLGMPIALGMSLKGHDVMGYGKRERVLQSPIELFPNVDINPTCCQKQSFPHREMGPGGESSIEVSSFLILFHQLNVQWHAELVFLSFFIFSSHRQHQ